MAGTRRARESGRGRSARSCGALLLILLVAAACGEDAAGGVTGETPLPLVARHQLDKAIDDPSGLALAGDILYVVSDRKRTVFPVTRHGVSVDGRRVAIAGPDEDGYEAAAWADGLLYVAHEPSGEIRVVAPPDGAVRETFVVVDLADGNSGIEGLLVRPDGGLLVAKEKDPSLLVHLDPDGTEVARVALDFAPDIADLAPLGDPDCPDQLLAVSQEARTVYQIDETGGLRGAWSIDAERPEGLAYDGATLYVADESARDLLAFVFPGGCRAPGASGPPIEDVPASADAVRLNEVMPANVASATDEFGEADDWIELHNASAVAVSLGGWYLSDDDAEPEKARLAAGLRIAAGGVLVLWADGATEQGPNHLPFSLSASHETLVLSDPDGREVDRYLWTSAPDDRSFARFPDGTGRFTGCDRPTPGAPNGPACAGTR